MVLHPDVYQRARAEIDRVVGSERLPDFEDREHLPYLECVVKEVFRYSPSLGQSVTHMRLLTIVRMNFRWNAPVPLGE